MRLSPKKSKSRKIKKPRIQRCMMKSYPSITFNRRMRIFDYNVVTMKIINILENETRRHHSRSYITLAKGSIHLLSRWRKVSRRCTKIFLRNASTTYMQNYSPVFTQRRDIINKMLFIGNFCREKWESES